MTLSASFSPQPFGRIVTAMVTPFDSSGAVDFQLAARLARHLVEQGSDGLLVCGPTGEPPTPSRAEQRKLLRVVRQEVGSEPTVLTGTGSNFPSEEGQADRARASRGGCGD